KKLKTEELSHGYRLSEFIKRPQISFKDLKSILNLPSTNDDVLNAAEVEFKYEGYIGKIKQEIDNFTKNEKRLIPEKINYNKVDHLALEAREKLNKIRPETI